MPAMLLVTSPAMSGRDVALIQEKLNGGQVMRRLRYVTQVNGFGRVTRRT